MFSRHHSKTSTKLWQMLEKCEARGRILEAIPKDYYPRLDDVAGRNFLALWMDRFHDVALAQVFIERGMDINTPVNDKGDTLLHAILRKASSWEYVIAGLVDHVPEVDVTYRNHHGDRPLDSFIRARGEQDEERFVYRLMMREADDLAFGPATDKKQEHLKSRVFKLVRHFDKNEIDLLIPAHVTLDARGGDGKSLLLHMVKECDLSILRHVFKAGYFRQADLSEPVLEDILYHHGDNNPLPHRVLGLYGAAVVTEGVLEQLVRLKNLDLIEACLALKAAAGTAAEQQALAHKVFADIVATEDPWLAIKALALPSLRAVATIDTPVQDDGKTLLVQAIERGRDKAVHDLLAAGASILMPDGTGAMVRAALDTAKKKKGEKVSELVEPLFAALLRRGNYERVHETQVSCKNGVLTYIFDFYAGQVVVRDDETKNIAVTSFNEFAKSGAEMLAKAASSLKELDGNTHGFDVPQGMTAGIVRKAPRIVPTGKG